MPKQLLKLMNKKCFDPEFENTFLWGFQPDKAQVNLATGYKTFSSSQPGPEVIIFFSMLNSAEHEIYPAHTC